MAKSVPAAKSTLGRPLSKVPPESTAPVAPLKRARGRPATGTSPAPSGSYLALVARGHALQLKSLADWCVLILTNRLPGTLPARPELEFADKFKENPALAWQQFLGLEAPPSKEELELLPDADLRGYVEFEYAREMARGLGLTVATDWYAKAGFLHACCPREPWAVYFNHGYTTLESFVGLPEAPAS
jgi:hypothetical protein